MLAPMATISEFRVQEEGRPQEHGAQVPEEWNAQPSSARTAAGNKKQTRIEMFFAGVFLYVQDSTNSFSKVDDDDQQWRYDGTTKSRFYVVYLYRRKGMESDWSSWYETSRLIVKFYYELQSTY